MIYRCPSPGCEFESHSLDGVASHYVQKPDGSHDEWSEKWRLKAHLDGLDSGDSGDRADPADGPTDFDSGDSGDSGDFGLPTWPEPEPETPGVPGSPGGPSCCLSPRLVGSGGDVYQLSDGSAVKLEPGEQICANCDEIHE